ncbi:DASH family cryptochrome [Psychrobacter sp. NZS113]|uniref:DASH family cryptochrome n=1 Tax=Psychrobacter sp. NZS113 TaxID=2792045 RepID=UPI0018CCE67D|nr:DASH family cryptochrome [Psychrobacter sp. NZS113]MBH0095704.1 DASH family cryptochrome [Psychrobacter sp. NZS113]
MSNPQLDSLTKKPTDKEAVLVLFYNDLRIDDNATLAKAAMLAQDNHRQLLLVYTDALADSIGQTHKSQAYDFDQIGDARQQFLSESLSDLDESLQRLGNRLLHLTPHTSSATLDTFTQLCQLIEQQHVTDICVSKTADYNQNQAYSILKRKYPQVRWHEQVTNTLFASLPMEALPKSFTQFRKQVESEHDLLNAETDVVISPAPESLSPMPDNLINGIADSHSLFFNKDHLDVQLPSEFKGGEANATGHLNNYFNSDAPSTYKTTRNALDDWTHSTKFSAWLANGTLSVNMLLNRLRHYEREVVANESTYWIWFELLWREYFYWYAMTHQQKLFWFKGIAQQSPTTGFDKGRLEQWKEGNTPYPIVNACMNQLKQTGYMSNRGRQIVASCFIHELGLDWRYGATHFEQYLIDYDVASNWGNWQYLAGVGADPRGCRQFNLAKQTQQYDPSGSFIHKWQADNTDNYVLSSP